MQNHRSKSLAALAYFWWIGWFAALAIFAKNRNNFCKFHLKQALVLHLTWTIITLLDLYIEDFFAHGQAIIWITWLILITLAIDGITIALQQKQQYIPIIGWISQKIFKNEIDENPDNQRPQS